MATILYVRLLVRQKAQSRTIDTIGSILESTENANERQRSNRSRLFGIAIAALIVRACIMFFGYENLSADPDAYVALAKHLSATGTYGLPGVSPTGETISRPTAFRPPLYPYVLSWLTKDRILSRFAVAILHIVLGVSTVLIAATTCSRLFENQTIGRISIIASILVMFDPILLQQSTQVMTESMATLLAMAIIWYWVRFASRGFSVSAAIGLSGLLALGYLCRPPFLVFAALLVAASLLATNKTWARRIAVSAAISILVIFAVGAWTIRNTRAIGHPVWATSHGGYTVLLANNPPFYSYLRDGRWGEAWDAQPFLNAYIHRYDGDPNTDAFWRKQWPSTREHDASQTPVTEHQDDQRCYLAARATIDREPGMFLWSCIVRVGRLWSPFPHHTPGRSWLKVVLIGTFYVVISVAALVTLWRHRNRIFRPEFWAIWLLAVTLSAVHAVYWSNLRMRAPIIPAIAIIASASIVPPSSRRFNDKIEA